MKDFDDMAEKFCKYDTLDAMQEVYDYFTEPRNMKDAPRDGTPILVGCELVDGNIRLHAHNIHSIPEISGMFVVQWIEEVDRTVSGSIIRCGAWHMMINDKPQMMMDPVCWWPLHHNRWPRTC